MRTVCFTFILFLAVISNSVAQTEKGRWLVGAQVGDFTYRKAEREQGHFATISLSPSASYFIVKNLSIGVIVPFSFSAQKLTYSPSYYNRSIGIGPHLQYYIGNAKVKPYVGIGYTYNRNYTKWGDGVIPDQVSESKG